jgi:hypothetical protein
MWHKTARQLALGLIIVLLFGLTSYSSSSSPSDVYELTVHFDSANRTAVHEIKLDLVPGVPFAVRIQDGTNYHYEVSGTLRQITQEKFELNPGKVEKKGLGGSMGFALLVLPFVLGKEEGCLSIEGGGTEGIGALLTKK